MGNQSENKENEEESRTQELVELFKDCARMEQVIKKMDRSQLLEKLEYYGIDKTGKIYLLRKRLKCCYRRYKLASVEVDIKNPAYPYYVIIDFEATCLEKNRQDFPHEIIEFPAVLLNSKTLEVVDTFQMYCKPVINPKLSDFCVELTGITQAQVDSAESFETVFKHFEKWLKKHRLMQKDKFAVVADAPWDMTRFLYQQCVYAGVPFPHWGKKWVNLKYQFQRFYKVKARPLRKMLRYFDMEFEGRLHCGLDDAKNLTRIVIKMIQDGAHLAVNESIIIYRHRTGDNHIAEQERKDDGDGDKNTAIPVARANYRALDFAGRNYEHMLRQRDKKLKALEEEIMQNHIGEKISEDVPVEWPLKEQGSMYKPILK